MPTPQGCQSTQTLHYLFILHYITLHYINLKISEWLGSISVTRVLETTLADHKWTDGGVKSDVLTPIQGSSSVMNDYKNTARRLICTTGGGESKLGRPEKRGRDESSGVENEKNEWVGNQ